MAIEILRIFYSVWIFGIIVFLLNAIANSLFSKCSRRISLFLFSIPFMLIWPLALFSPNGRKILFLKIEKL